MALMSVARRTVEEYTALLARAFNGAVEVDGQRIVAHPSGTLLARPRRTPAGTESPVLWQALVAPSPAHDSQDNRDNDWSDV